MLGVTFNARIADNLRQEKRRGMELTFSQKLDDHFGYNLGYSYTKIDDKLLWVAMSGDYGQPHGYRAGLHYNNRGFRANLSGIMASGLNTAPDSNGNGIGFVSKNYAVFNFNLSYDFNEHATIYFKANNFTNQNYSNVSKNDRSPGRQLLAGATFRF